MAGTTVAPPVRSWRERLGVLRGGGAAGPALMLAMIVLFDLLAHRPNAHFPNPPALLIAIVVFSGFIGGLASSLLSAALMWAYIAYFFSMPGRLFHYTDENFYRVVVWGLVTPAMAIMVGVQKGRLLERERRQREREIVRSCSWPKRVKSTPPVSETRRERGRSPGRLRGHARRGGVARRPLSRATRPWRQQ